MSGFERGTPIVMRSIAPTGVDGVAEHAGHTYPAIVIQDTEEAIVTYQAVDTVLMERTGERQQGGRLMVLGGWHGGYAPRTWAGDPVVRVYRPGSEWSVWRWLDANGDWTSWFYVNLEEPWTRSRFGFDTNDWILDLVVTREPLDIRFKDEDELRWSLESTIISEREHDRIVAAGARARRSAEADEWPFSADWDQWRPDAGLPIPILPDDWNRLP